MISFFSVMKYERSKVVKQQQRSVGSFTYVCTCRWMRRHQGYWDQLVDREPSCYSRIFPRAVAINRSSSRTR